MLIVKIVAGTYGHKVGKHIKPKDRTSEPFALADDEAKRLVDLGVAEIVTEGVATGGNGKENVSPSVNPSNDENGSNDKNEGENNTVGNLDVEQLNGMKIKELKVLAENMGIDTSKMKTRDDYIQAIVGVEVTVSAEDATNDSEQPPTLDVEAPVV